MCNIDDAQRIKGPPPALCEIPAGRLSGTLEKTSTHDQGLGDGRLENRLRVDA
jgi:hypothetical protein